MVAEVGCCLEGGGESRATLLERVPAHHWDQGRMKNWVASNLSFSRQQIKIPVPCYHHLKSGQRYFVPLLFFFVNLIDLSPVK